MRTVTGKLIVEHDFDEDTTDAQVEAAIRAEMAAKLSDPKTELVIIDPLRIKEWVASELANYDCMVVDVGMEHPCAYIVLEVQGQTYFVLERRNDDGEWAPLMFEGSGTSPVEYRAAMMQRQNRMVEVDIDDVLGEGAENDMPDVLYLARDMFGFPVFHGGD